MKIKGIIYDVGLQYWEGQPFRKISEEMMRNEFKIIKEELNCNAIGFHGSFNDKLLNAAKIALENGLEVWLFPRYINKNSQETIELFKELASGAENLRKEYENVILGIGDELTVNCSSFFSGKNYVDRVRRLKCYIDFKKILPVIMGRTTPDWLFKFKNKEEELNMLIGEFGDKESIIEMEEIAKLVEVYLKNFDEKFMQFISELVKVARDTFKGKISYSSGWWEEIDWNLFDIIGIGIYLDSSNWFTYEKTLRQLKEKFKRPLVVTEFGASTFKYASMYGGGAWTIFEKFEVERSEEEQAEHIKRQFNLIKKSGADGAFCFIFVDVPEKIHVENPKNYKEDGDRGGYGIMKIMPDGHLEPKKAFYTLKELYSQS
jgi:hypothetical protein